MFHKLYAEKLQVFELSKEITETSSFFSFSFSFSFYKNNEHLPFQHS